MHTVMHRIGCVFIEENVSQDKRASMAKPYINYKIYIHSLDHLGELDLQPLPRCKAMSIMVSSDVYASPFLNPTSFL